MSKHPQWAPLVQHSMIHMSSVTPIANVLKISVSGFKGYAWDYCASIKRIDIGDEPISLRSAILSEVRIAALHDALYLISQTEHALNSQEVSMLAPLWDSTGLSRYGVSTRLVAPLISLQVQRKMEQWETVVYTACGEYRTKLLKEISDAQTAAQDEARTMLIQARAEVTELLNTELLTTKLLNGGS